jgi:hypothetical protein
MATAATTWFARRQVRPGASAGEVIVLMQDDQAGALGDGGDEQIRYRRCAVVTSIDKDG